jgi:hypothetical protein
MYFNLVYTFIFFATYIVYLLFLIIFGYTADYKRNPNEFLRTFLIVFFGMVSFGLLWLILWIDRRIDKQKKRKRATGYISPR